MKCSGGVLAIKLLFRAYASEDRNDHKSEDCRYPTGHYWEMGSSVREHGPRHPDAREHVKAQRDDPIHLYTIALERKNDEHADETSDPGKKSVIRLLFRRRSAHKIGRGWMILNRRRLNWLRHLLREIEEPLLVAPVATPTIAHWQSFHREGQNFPLRSMVSFETYLASKTAKIRAEQ